MVPRLAARFPARLPALRSTAWSSQRLLPACTLPRVCPPTSCSYSTAPSPPSFPPASIPPPLQGYRVLDLTRVLAGPYCTMLLSDLGADVIKVENPSTNGDDTRSWAPPGAINLPSDKFPSWVSPEEKKRWEALPDESAYFLSVNRGKRSLTLDLKSPKAREVMHRLIQSADVVIENYLPGKLNKMGLGYEQVKAIKEDVIYASLTGYGQTGPYANAPGYDVIIAADAGFFHITGYPDRPGIKCGVAITDLTTGLYVHGAILASLLGRTKTGKGVHIDSSLFDSQIASLANVGSSYLVAGQEGGRYGTAHSSIVPYQVFPTQDSFVIVGAGNDGQFRLLSEMLGQPEMGSPTGPYATNALRVANREELIPLLSGLFQQQPNAHWLKHLEGRLPIAPIRNIQQTFEHPQALARGVVSEMHHPRIGPLKVVSPAVVYGQGRMPLTRPPPVLGQHSYEVLQELGYSEGEMEGMEKAVGFVPRPPVAA